MTATVERDSWTLELPYRTPPLSLNDRDHWAVKAAKTKEVRDAVIVLARHARIPKCERIAVLLYYQPAVIRRRDAENLAGTLKPAVDGLVDVGVIPDDTPDYLHSATCRISTIVSRPGRLRLVIRRLA